jgi:hypothetical protein
MIIEWAIITPQLKPVLKYHPNLTGDLNPGGSPFKVVLIFDKFEKNHLKTPSKKELLNTIARFHSKVKVCQICQTRHKMSGRPICFTTLNQIFF